MHSGVERPRCREYWLGRELLCDPGTPDWRIAEGGATAAHGRDPVGVRASRAAVVRSYAASNLKAARRAATFRSPCPAVPGRRRDRKVHRIAAAAFRRRSWVHAKAPLTEIKAAIDAAPIIASVRIFFLAHHLLLRNSYHAARRLVQPQRPRHAQRYNLRHAAATGEGKGQKRKRLGASPIRAKIRFELRTSSA